MSWKLVWSARASREMRHLDPSTARRIGRAVTAFAETEQGDVKRLESARPEWRLRVGDWRVRFVFDRATNTMTVLRVLPRGRAYRE